MIQNNELTNALGLLAAVINERAELVHANGYDPQVLVDQLSNINYQLIACIDPDELEKLG